MYKLGIKLLLVVSIMFSFLIPGSSRAIGNIYYVSITGSDSGLCTRTQPWKTIGKGVSGLNPGDTLYLRSGTYLQSSKLSVSRSGTALPGWYCTVTPYEIFCWMPTP